MGFVFSENACLWCDDFHRIPHVIASRPNSALDSYWFVPISFNPKLQKFPDDLKYVRIHPCQLSAAVKYHYSSDAQISAMRRDQPTETQPSSLVLQVTGMYLYSHTLRSTNFIFPCKSSKYATFPDKRPSLGEDQSSMSRSLTGQQQGRHDLCGERGIL
jgi:hypothetical protein